MAGNAIRLSAAPFDVPIEELAAGGLQGPAARLWGMKRSMSFGHEGDGGLGDRLVAAVLRGEKTATTSLAVEYLSGEPLPRVGERQILKDHAGQVYGIVETTRVAIIPLNLVGDDVAEDEGEGFADAADWRRVHVAFWNEVRDHIRAEASDPDWCLRDAEPVVVEWFRLVGPVGPHPRPDEQAECGHGHEDQQGDLIENASPLPGDHIAGRVAGDEP